MQFQKSSPIRIKARRTSRSEDTRGPIYYIKRPLLVPKPTGSPPPLVILKEEPETKVGHSMLTEGILKTIEENSLMRDIVKRHALKERRRMEDQNLEFDVDQDLPWTC
jgi:hypothetical protein